MCFRMLSADNNSQEAIGNWNHLCVIATLLLLGGCDHQSKTPIDSTGLSTSNLERTESHLEMQPNGNGSPLTTEQEPASARVVFVVQGREVRLSDKMTRGLKSIVSSRPESEGDVSRLTYNVAEYGHFEMGSRNFSLLHQMLIERRGARFYTWTSDKSDKLKRMSDIVLEDMDLPEPQLGRMLRILEE